MVFAIGLIVISLGAIVAGRGYTNLARRMRSYGTTRGTVIGKEPAKVPSGDTTTGRWGKGGGYHPRVTYTYTVAGMSYTNDKVTFAIRGLKRELVEQELAVWPDEVDVHYDPANPQEAYLKKHTPTLGRGLIAGGSIGVLFGLIVLIGSI